MATLAGRHFVPVPQTGDERFFLRGAIVMTVIIVGAFGFHYLVGHSTLAAPLRVHLHAWVFMGWVGIYLLQNIFVARGRMDLRRRLGWLAVAWLVPMIVMGFVVTVANVRLDHVPFFFRPAEFLIFDPITVLTFSGLTIAAVLMRRRTEWHGGCIFAQCGCCWCLLSAACFRCRCCSRLHGRRPSPQQCSSHWRARGPMSGEAVTYTARGGEAWPS